MILMTTAISTTGITRKIRNRSQYRYQIINVVITHHVGNDDIKIGID